MSEENSCYLKVFFLLKLAFLQYQLDKICLYPHPPKADVKSYLVKACTTGKAKHIAPTNRQLRHIHIPVCVVPVKAGILPHNKASEYDQGTPQSHTAD